MTLAHRSTAVNTSRRCRWLLRERPMLHDCWSRARCSSTRRTTPTSSDRPLFKALADPVRLRLLSLIAAARRRGCVVRPRRADRQAASRPSATTSRCSPRPGCSTARSVGRWVWYRSCPSASTRSARAAHAPDGASSQRSLTPCRAGAPRRVRRHCVPRRRRRRLGHRGRSGCPRTTPGCSCSRTPPPPRALVALILAFGPVSGAHFNPVVSWPTRASAADATREPPPTSRQLAGAVVGAVVANLMFELDAGRHGRRTRAAAAGLWLAEVVATVRPAPGDLRRRARPGARDAAPVRRRRLHRRRLLLHVVDELRQPCGDHRPRRSPTLRRHRAGVGARRSSPRSSSAALLAVAADPRSTRLRRGPRRSSSPSDRRSS